MITFLPYCIYSYLLWESNKCMRTCMYKSNENINTRTRRRRVPDVAVPDFSAAYSLAAHSVTGEAF